MRLTMVLICFILSATLEVAGCQTARRGAEEPHQEELALGEKRLEDQEITFREQLAGSGKIDGVVPFSAKIFTSSDGIGVSVRVERYGTPSQARTALVKQVRQADRVIEQEGDLDAQTSDARVRLVLSLHGNGASQEAFVVLWIEGNAVYSIESRSLKHALLFEARPG